MTRFTVRMHATDTAASIYAEGGVYLGLVGILSGEGWLGAWCDPRCRLGCTSSTGCKSREGCRRRKVQRFEDDPAKAVMFVIENHGYEKPYEFEIKPAWFKDQHKRERTFTPAPVEHRRESKQEAGTEPTPEPVAEKPQKQQMSLEEHLKLAQEQIKQEFAR